MVMMIGEWNDDDDPCFQLIVWRIHHDEWIQNMILWFASFIREPRAWSHFHTLASSNII